MMKKALVVTILSTGLAGLALAAILTGSWVKANRQPGTDTVNRGGSFTGNHTGNSSASMMSNGEVCAAYLNTNGTAWGNELRVSCYDPTNGTWHGRYQTGNSDLIASGKVYSPAIANRTGDKLVVAFGDKNVYAGGKARVAQSPGVGSVWRGMAGSAYDEVSVVWGQLQPVEQVDLAISPPTQSPVVVFNNGRYVFNTVWTQSANRFRGRLQMDPDQVYYADPNTTVYGWIYTAKVACGPGGLEKWVWSGAATQQYNYAPMLVGFREWNGSKLTGRTKTNGVLNSLDWLPGRSRGSIDIAAAGYVGAVYVTGALDYFNPNGIWFVQHSGTVGDSWKGRYGQPINWISYGPRYYPSIEVTGNGRVDVMFYTASAIGPPPWPAANEIVLARSYPPNGVFGGIDGTEYEQVTSDGNGNQYPDVVIDQWGNPHYVGTACVGTSSNCVPSRVDHREWKP